MEPDHRKELPRPIVFILLSLVMISWFAQMAFPLESFDFYYHLAAGRWIAEHRSIPTHDVFSSTAAGTRWITHEWAAQLLLYGGHQAFGIRGLIIAKALWLSLAAGLLFLLGSHRGSPPAWTALLTAVAAPCIAFRAFLRPHVAGWGFLAIVLYLLYRDSAFMSKRFARMFPVLFLVWANCHSGFVFGLFVMGVFCVSTIVTPGSDHGSRALRIRSCAVIWLVSAAATLVNPNGWYAWKYPFLFIRHRDLFGVISELRPLTAPEFQGGWFIPITYALMICALIAGLLRWRDGGIRELALLAVFAPMAVAGVRNVPEMIIVALPGLMINGGAIFRSLGKRRNHFVNKVWRYGFLMPAAAVPLVLTGFALSDGIPIDGSVRRVFGTGIKDLNYPRGAVRYMLENTVQGRYFNTFAYGGYLLWALYPDPHVFIDGRLFVFIGDVLETYKKVMRGETGLDELAERFGVSHLILAYEGADESPGQGIYSRILQQPEWIPVYWDDASMIFIREGTGNGSLIDRDGYRALHPLKRTLGAIDAMIESNPEPALREAERAHLSYPQNTGAAVILGRWYAKRKEPEKAAEYYGLVLDRQPGNSIIRVQRALAWMEAGRFSDAAGDWRVIIEADRSDGFALMNMGICLHRMNRREDAFGYYARAEKQGYRSAELMNGIGIYHAERGDLRKASVYWRRGLEIDPDHSQLIANLQKAGRMLTSPASGHAAQNSGRSSE